MEDQVNPREQITSNIRRGWSSPSFVYCYSHSVIHSKSIVHSIDSSRKDNRSSILIEEPSLDSSGEHDLLFFSWGFQRRERKRSFGKSCPTSLPSRWSFLLLLHETETPEAAKLTILTIRVSRLVWEIERLDFQKLIIKTENLLVPEKQLILFHWYNRSWRKRQDNTTNSSLVLRVLLSKERVETRRKRIKQE
jgi:hypothetical protein